MMDILNLRNWYRTPTGHMARRYIQSALHDIWPQITGKRILVIGYGMPYIKLWLKEAQVFCAVPSKIGAIHWPNHQPNRVTLVEEANLPFADQFFDAIFVIHSLEFCSDEQLFLDECNRILKDDGRLLTIVPNRAGAWSHREISPLAQGTPFSQGQLQRALAESSFLVTQNFYALYTPPTNKEWLHKYSSTFERFGRRFNAPMGGVIVMEVKKDIHAPVVVRTSNLLGKNFILRPSPSYNLCK